MNSDAKEQPVRHAPKPSLFAFPNRFHEPLAIASIGADKHVLLEKPMALDAGGARSIYRAAKGSGKAAKLA